MENKPTVFLFTDTQVVDEIFLEDINNILSSGEVPNLYSKAEDFEEVLSAYTHFSLPSSHAPTSLPHHHMHPLLSPIITCTHFSPPSSHAPTSLPHHHMHPLLSPIITCTHFSPPSSHAPTSLPHHHMHPLLSPIITCTHFSPPSHAPTSLPHHHMHPLLSPIITCTHFSPPSSHAHNKSPMYTSQVRNALSPTAKKEGIPETNDSIFTFFIERVRNNLHIVLCMSPVGDPFRNRIRQYPAFVNCTTIDWFSEWPKDALLEVAERYIEDVNFQDEENEAQLRKNISSVFVTVHRSVAEMSDRMMTEMKRHNYVTATNYLELVTGYKVYVPMCDDPCLC